MVKRQLSLEKIEGPCFKQFEFYSKMVADETEEIGYAL